MKSLVGASRCELCECSLRTLVLTCWPLLARPRTAGGRCLDHHCQHRLSSCWQVVPGTTVPPAHLYIYIISTYLHIYTMKHTWPGVSITDHTGQWPGPKQSWFMRVIICSDSVHFQHLHCLSSIYTLWCMLGSILDSTIYLYPTKKTDHVWKCRKTETIVHVWRVFSSSIHCKLSKVHIEH